MNQINATIGVRPGLDANEVVEILGDLKASTRISVRLVSFEGDKLVVAVPQKQHDAFKSLCRMVPRIRGIQWRRTRMRTKSSSAA